ncbi:hypothetical protein GZH53_04710 [Flavihumibacter sp. R14]|nr:hypothetical protein [Flavihumibacter soli]
MKIYTKLLVIATTLIFAACSKENGEIIDVFGDPGVLVGKWKLSETLNDPGDGSGEWRKVKGTDYYIAFKANGEVSGNALPGYAVYSVRDSTVITFTKADGITYQNYSYQLKDGKLNMSPAGPIMCIEACGSRYVKVE